MTVHVNSDQLPPFLLNSIPKSGTHLMSQILLGIPEITFSIENHSFSSDLERPFLEKIKANQFARGHIRYTPDQAALLQEFKMKQIFLYRDPRDIVVSLVYYVERVKNETLHPILKGLTKKEQYMIAINGIEKNNFKLNNIANRINFYVGWIGKPNVLPVKYEDLRFSKKTLSVAARSIAQFLFEDLHPPAPIHRIVKKMKKNIDPSNSPTYRSGKIGDWRHEFDEEVKEAFKDVGGNLLIDLGFETDKNW